MPRVLSLIGALTILAAATPLRAQQSAPPIEIRAGSRVRLDAPGIVAKPLVATVISQTRDTLKVASQDVATVAVPLDRITRLEVSRGDSRSAGAIHGMKWGLPIGIGSGVLLVALSDDCKTCTNQPSAGGAIGTAAAMGAGLGAIIGAVVQHERWAPLALTPHVSFDSRAARGTLALHARL
jgi:hypothetical protein